MKVLPPSLSFHFSPVCFIDQIGFGYAILIARVSKWSHKPTPSSQQKGNDTRRRQKNDSPYTPCQCAALKFLKFHLFQSSRSTGFFLVQYRDWKPRILRRGTRQNQRGNRCDRWRLSLSRSVCRSCSHSAHIRRRGRRNTSAHRANRCRKHR